MLKRILSVLGGIGVAFLIIMLNESVVMKIYPLPVGIDPNDAEAMKHLIIPVGALVLLMVGYAIASFAAGIVSSMISGRENAQPALIAGGILTVGGIINMIEIPHPWWFMILNVLIYIPFAYRGFMIVKKKVSIDK